MAKYGSSQVRVRTVFHGLLYISLLCISSQTRDTYECSTHKPGVLEVPARHEAHISAPESRGEFHARCRLRREPATRCGMRMQGSRRKSRHKANYKTVKQNLPVQERLFCVMIAVLQIIVVLPQTSAHEDVDSVHHLISSCAAESIAFLAQQAHAMTTAQQQKHVNPRSQESAPEPSPSCAAPRPGMA